MTTIVIQRGLPASGKTTSARRWLAEKPDRRARVNRDDIRAMLFAEPTYQFDQEQHVTDVERELARRMLRAGWDVIVDDTNLRPKYVREWLRFARANGVDEFVVNHFYIDPDDAVARDAARDRTVGEDVIRNMARKFLKRDPNAAGGYEFLLPAPVGEEQDGPAPDLYVADPRLPHAVIVDVDGTVAIKHSTRDIHDMSKVHLDLRNEPVIAAVQAANRDGMQIVFCSGRDETARLDTVQWLADHVEVPFELWMRPAGDKRKDAIVKRELFDANIRDRYAVQYVIDDRDQVVEMWRGLGLTCLQCAPGDF